MQFVKFMLDFVPTLLCAVLILRIVTEFVPLRFRNFFLYAVEAVMLVFALNVIVYPEEVTGTFGNMLGLAAALVIFHKGQWYMKVTAVLIIFPVMTAAAFLTQDLGQMIWMYGFDKELSAFGEDALYLITHFLRLPIWYLIYRCVKEWMPGAVRMLTRRMWLVLSLISLASFIGIIIIIYKCTVWDSYLAWPACAAALITSMGCCYLCTYMAKIVRADMELETMRYQKSYYQEIESSQQTVRRMRHDMKNHLSVVETLLRDGRYEKAEEYLHGLDQEFASKTRVCCPDPVVNAVLNAKMERAQEEGIACEYQVDLKEAAALTDIELCSLFANTLDNAIEACVKIKDREKRRTTLKARSVNGHFSYEIVNAKENKVTERNGSFETDKEDKGSHGIGLWNVRQIVQKYEGEMDVSYTDETFSVTILI